MKIRERREEIRDKIRVIIEQRAKGTKKFERISENRVNNMKRTDKRRETEYQGREQIDEITLKSYERVTSE